MEGNVLFRVVMQIVAARPMGPFSSRNPCTHKSRRLQFLVHRCGNHVGIHTLCLHRGYPLRSMRIPSRPSPRENTLPPVSHKPASVPPPPLPRAVFNFAPPLSLPLSITITLPAIALSLPATALVILIVAITPRPSLSRLGRQPAGKPPVPLQIHAQLAHLVRHHLHALRAERLALILGAARVVGPALVSREESTTSRTSKGWTHRGEMAPLALMTRCHGTVSLLNSASGFEERCLRQTPTCRGLSAAPISPEHRIYGRKGSGGGTHAFR